jgi:hypothetical protein
MAERQADPALRQTGTALRRRGLIAGAAALVTGIVTRQAAPPVAASTGMLIANVPGLVNNPIQDQTSLTGPVPNGATVLVADARTSSGNAFGFYGFGAGTYAGVGGAGRSNGDGVFGVATGPLSRGVHGQTDLGDAVHGEATGNGNGVFGVSPSLVGVYGLSTSGVGTAGG